MTMKDMREIKGGEGVLLNFFFFLWAYSFRVGKMFRNCAVSGIASDHSWEFWFPKLPSELYFVS